MLVLFVGPGGTTGLADAPVGTSFGTILFALWALGAIGLFAVCAVRHRMFCTRVRATGTGSGRIGGIELIAADVDAPLAFGVFRRIIAVPRMFARDYTPRERRLALAHECAHHARGDLVANWASLVVLAAHWWNPVAWAAIRAFRDDQEYAADGDVLAREGTGAARDTPALYATVLAKAAGVGALPACNLNARSNLKGRLMMLARKPVSGGRLLVGTAVLALFGSAALAATVAKPHVPRSTSGRQAVTIAVKPDASGGYTLIVRGSAVAPGAPLPGGAVLPPDLGVAGGCSLKPDAKPHAMVIKGSGKTQTYTVMCAKRRARSGARYAGRGAGQFAHDACLGRYAARLAALPRGRARACPWCDRPLDSRGEGAARGCGLTRRLRLQDCVAYAVYKPYRHNCA